MNSSFGTTVARHPRQHSRHCLASEPLAAQPGTNKFAELKTSSTTPWGLLKQPDNQQSSNPARSHPELSPNLTGSAPQSRVSKFNAAATEGRIPFHVLIISVESGNRGAERSNDQNNESSSRRA